jgi:XTP/dITP diphosphohydrolase
VAASVTEKLINRHPHVFGDVVANTSEEVKQNWDQIKNAEKGRTSPIDGVPLGQPALQLAAKLLHRAEKNKLARPNTDLPKSILDNSKDLESDLGEAIFSFTAWAVENGIDPEAALRKVSLKYAEKLANEKTL